MLFPVTMALAQFGTSWQNCCLSWCYHLFTAVGTRWRRLPSPTEPQVLRPTIPRYCFRSILACASRGDVKRACAVWRQVFAVENVAFTLPNDQGGRTYHRRHTRRRYQNSEACTRRTIRLHLHRTTVQNVLGEFVLKTAGLIIGMVWFVCTFFSEFETIRDTIKHSFCTMTVIRLSSRLTMHHAWWWWWWWWWWWFGFYKLHITHYIHIT